MTPMYRLPLLMLACSLYTACGADAMTTEKLDALTTGDPLLLADPLLLDPPEVVKPRCGLHLSRRVAPPRFRFDDGTAQGWQLDGVYFGGTETREINFAAPAGWANNTNSPNALGMDPLNADGSAWLQVQGGLGLLLAAPSPNGYHHIDFVSPPLQGWETFTRYQYQLARSAGIGAIYGQLLVKIRKCDGNVRYLAEFVGNAPQFCEVVAGQPWTACNTTLTWPSDVDQVLNVIVRIFFDAHGAFEGGVFLDDVGITPLPGRLL